MKQNCVDFSNVFLVSTWQPRTGTTNRCMGRRWLGSTAVPQPPPPEPRPPKERPRLDPVAVFHSLPAGRICSDCSGQIFGESKTWQSATICGHCHTDRLTTIPATVRDYIAAIYSRGCEFCGTKVGRFHLDHINMFSKTGGVIQMMESGSPLADLVAEVAKCQLLCVACHEIVSAFEESYGFFTKKAILNQMIRRCGAADPRVCKKRATFSAEYSEVLWTIYPLIRSVVSERRRVGCS